MDPWSAGGVLVNVSNKLPSFVITGGAHHLGNFYCISYYGYIIVTNLLYYIDLRGSNPNDPASVIRVRNDEIGYIQNWIQEHNMNLKKY